MRTVQIGPLESEAAITAGLDYYKMTMGQFAYEQQPDAQTTFTFNNRTQIPLANHIDIDELQARLSQIGAQGFTKTEADYLLQIDPDTEIFTPEFANELETLELPEIHVSETDENDLQIESHGPWWQATYWETIVMSTVNEMYFESLVRDRNLDINDVYDEGDARLSAKIDRINEYNASLPEETDKLTFVDFGTRRHFSKRWHEHVLGRLEDELEPGTMLGTSNVFYAQQLETVPVGTYAHEMPMVYAGLEDGDDTAIRSSHTVFLQQWAERYPTLKTALCDTFGDDFFFEDLSTNGLAATYSGLRHDSGDPFEFGERVVDFYLQHDIDPAEKTIVFSDGLDLEKIIKLHEAFAGRINVTFGWGTNLTNDLGIDALSIVMKATSVNGAETVKLSNNPNKFTGPKAQVDRYVQIFNYLIERAVAEATRY